MPLICRRCLLADMEDERPLHLLMREWIEAIPEHNKAALNIYQARLSACQFCDHLANGLCRQCGCYVELRAAKANQRCPAAPAKWLPNTPIRNESLINRMKHFPGPPCTE